MIRGETLTAVLSRKIPGLELQHNSDNTEETMLQFADFTRHAARCFNATEVKNCLETAAHLYLTGDDTIRTTIERIYLPALRNMLCKNSPGSRLLKTHLPLNLYHLYINQVYK